MTPKQADRLRQKIAAIRRALAAEKRRFGAYDDSRGLRYFPTRYYVQLGDFAGGRTYVRWFAKSFPDDAGFTDFLLEWTIILFHTGQPAAATQKALEAHCADLHLFDRFLERPSTPPEPWEPALQGADTEARYFEALGRPTALREFAAWLAAVTETEPFRLGARRFVDLNRQLHGEQDAEKRRSLVRQLYPPARKTPPRAPAPSPAVRANDPDGSAIDREV